MDEQDQCRENSPQWRNRVLMLRLVFEEAEGKEAHQGKHCSRDQVDYSACIVWKEKTSHVVGKTVVLCGIQYDQEREHKGKRERLLSVAAEKKSCQKHLMKVTSSGRQQRREVELYLHQEV